MGAEIAGVDLIHDPDGAPLVLEVNSMAGWYGLQQVTDFPIADRLAAEALGALS
jgi:glutathione synthase/RimK-type ligase-like ATP-grasp enzyme